MKICKREKSDKKIESKFDNGKKTIKSWNVLSSGVELETFHNGKGKNREKCQKKIFCFCWDLNSRPFITAEVGNYLENRSNDYKYSNLLIDGQMFLFFVGFSRFYLFS